MLVSELAFQIRRGRPTPRESAGRADQHPCELVTAVEEIEHRTTQCVDRPQSNGFLERFHRTLLDEHLRPSGRKEVTLAA